MTSERKIVSEQGTIGPLGQGSSYSGTATSDWESTDDPGFRYKALYEAPG